MNGISSHRQADPTVSPRVAPLHERLHTFFGLLSNVETESVGPTHKNIIFQNCSIWNVDKSGKEHIITNKTRNHMAERTMDVSGT